MNYKPLEQSFHNSTTGQSIHSATLKETFNTTVLNESNFNSSFDDNHFILICDAQYLESVEFRWAIPWCTLYMKVLPTVLSVIFVLNIRLIVQLKRLEHEKEKRRKSRMFATRKVSRKRKGNRRLSLELRAVATGSAACTTILGVGTFSHSGEMIFTLVCIPPLICAIAIDLFCQLAVISTFRLLQLFKHELSNPVETKESRLDSMNYKYGVGLKQLVCSTSFAIQMSLISIGCIVIIYVRVATDRPDDAYRYILVCGFLQLVYITTKNFVAVIRMRVKVLAFLFRIVGEQMEKDKEVRGSVNAALLANRLATIRIGIIQCVIDVSASITGMVFGIVTASVSASQRTSVTTLVIAWTVYCIMLAGFLFTDYKKISKKLARLSERRKKAKVFAVNQHVEHIATVCHEPSFARTSESD